MSGTIKIDLLSPSVDVQVPSTGVKVGFAGPQGPQGEGAVLDIQGTLPDGNPPTEPGAEPGDAWIDPTGGVWVWDGAEWTRITAGIGPTGPQGIAGPTGPTGPTGPAATGGLDQATADALYVNVAGDQMEGPLRIATINGYPGDPEDQGQGSLSHLWIEAQTLTLGSEFQTEFIATGAQGKVTLAGTGGVQIGAGDGLSIDANSPINMVFGDRITNLGEPVDPQDAASRAYVDSRAAPANTAVYVVSATEPPDPTVGMIWIGG